VGPRTVHEWTKSIGNIFVLAPDNLFQPAPKEPTNPRRLLDLGALLAPALTRSALTNRHRTAGTATATAGKVEGTGGERGSDFSVALGREQGAGAGQKK